MTRTLLVMATVLVARLAVADEPAFGGRPLSGWLTMLREDPLPRKRRAAAVALGQLAAENAEAKAAALPALGRAVRNDSQPTVRAAVASALAQHTGEKPELFFLDAVEALRIEKDSAVRRELAVCFGRLGPKAGPAAQPLTAALLDADPATRSAAADALGRIGAEAKSAAPALVKLAGDTDSQARRSAAFALGRIDPEDKPTAARALANLLQVERAADVRLRAASAVASGRAFISRDSDTILNAVVALGLLADRSAETVDALLDTLADPEPDVRRQVALSIRKLGPAGKTAETKLAVVARSDPDRYVRIYSLQALSAAFADDPKPILSLLAERLKADPDYEVRVAIAVELGGFGVSATGAISALREAQRDPQLKVREAATAALRQIQNPVPPTKP